MSTAMTETRSLGWAGGNWPSSASARGRLAVRPPSTAATRGGVG